MNLKEMSVTELKALAYDTFAAIQRGQQALGTINDEIASRPIEAKQEETPK